MGIGIRERADLPPAAIARGASVEDHLRAARALQPAPSPRAVQLTEKLEALRAQIAQFRARAIDLHVKLMELEATGDPDVRALRASMMANVVRIEGVVRALVDASDAPAPARFPHGTIVKR
jgi:phage shock protein A